MTYNSKIIILIYFLFPYGILAQELNSVKAQILNLDSVRTLIYQSQEVQTLKEAGLPCRLIVKITIDKNGKYQTHEIIKPCHPIAVKAIDAHIEFFRFLPAMNNGHPVRSELVTYFTWTTR